MPSTGAADVVRGDVNAAELSLSGMQLTSLDALLPLLVKMPRLRRLDLSQNELRDLPKDLSALDHLEELDLRSNPIGGVHYILDGLQSLPRLSSLSVSLKLPVEEEQLILRLPALTVLNGTDLFDPAEDADSTPSANRVFGNAAEAASLDSGYWRPADSQGIESLFADICRQDASTTQEFADYMNRVVQHVTCLTAAEDDELAQEGEVLKARRLLYEYCFGEVTRCVFKDGNAELGQQLQSLLRYESALMDQYDLHWRRLMRDRDDRLAHTRRDIEAAMADIHALMQHVPTGDAPEPSRTDARVSPRRIESAPKDAHGSGSGALDGGSSSSLNATPLIRNGHSTHMDVSGLGTSPQPVPPTGYARYSQRPSPESKTRPSTFTKVLSLRQLKECIEDLYVSKLAYDDKCMRHRLPRETMEQHMYTYLNQRYGLRGLILEWAAAIVQAVRRYAPEDNDVAVFGKVLRNEVDEEFRFVQQHVRGTVRELLRQHLKSKMPLCGVAELDNALQKAMNGVMAEEAWKEVVTYMYNASDAALLTDIIRAHLHPQVVTPPQRHVRGGEAMRLSKAVAPQLRYKDFVRLLLDFQLDGHERFLKPYVTLFRRYDSDFNGIVNESEFTAILHDLDPSKTAEEVQAVVQGVDPHGNQLITFSESVAFLNSELLRLASRTPPAAGNGGGE